MTVPSSSPGGRPDLRAQLIALADVWSNGALDRRTKLSHRWAEQAAALMREAADALASSPGVRVERWEAIEKCPREVTRAILFWPTFAVNEDLEQTDVRVGDGLVAEGFRVGRNAWECDIVTEHFEDEAGFGYGDPTHYQLHPDPPETPKEQG